MVYLFVRVVTGLSRRPPNNALEMLIFVVLLIPIGVYYLIKWIVRGIILLCAWASNRKHGGGYPSIDMTTADQMDGVAFENFIADLLRNNGYKKVKTTKASADYGVDIVAVKDGKNYAFQCKCYSSNLGVKPVQEVYAGARMYHADIMVVITNTYFTVNAINLADKLNVLLWNRDYLACLAGNTLREEKIQCTPIKNLNMDIKSKTTLSKSIEQEREINAMATILKAGKYIFGTDIPIGRYSLRAVKGSGRLEYMSGESGMWFGIDNDYDAKEYRNLEGKEGQWFELTGNLEVEITRSKMIVIED